MMTQAILGIDVSKKILQVALLQKDDKPKQKHFENTPVGHQRLLKWLSQQAFQVHACLESTSTYGEAIAEALVNAKHLVSIVNPARVKGFAISELSRTKTDQVDAALIARFCLALKPSLWQPLPVELRQLRELVRRIEALNQLIVQERNRLETATATTTALIEAHIDYLRTQLKTIRKLIQQHFKQHSQLSHHRDLLMSIPGIGETTAAILLAEIRDWQRFNSAKQFAAYIGLTPKERSSGSSVRGRPQLSRMGSARLKKALYLPAVVAKSHNPLVKAFCERLLSRGKSTMQVVGAAMRKLAHLAYGVLKSNQPFTVDYGQSKA